MFYAAEVPLNSLTVGTIFFHSHSVCLCMLVWKYKHTQKNVWGAEEEMW